ncbi:hypothetical protein CI102_10036 [Trichoderma harzianum]|nr:hypothetical protein CI102_10036 [Trichoderma harzianum]
MVTLMGKGTPGSCSSDGVLPWLLGSAAVAVTSAAAVTRSPACSSSHQLTAGAAGLPKVSCYSKALASSGCPALPASGFFSPQAEPHITWHNLERRGAQKSGSHKPAPSSLYVPAIYNLRYNPLPAALLVPRFFPLSAQVPPKQAAGHFSTRLFKHRRGLSCQLSATARAGCHQLASALHRDDR